MKTRQCGGGGGIKLPKEVLFQVLTKRKVRNLNFEQPLELVLCFFNKHDVADSD